MTVSANAGRARLPWPLLAVVFAAGALPPGAACAEEDEPPSVTPYRPTVSNPAALPVPGWLEVEFGTNRQTPGDGSRLTSFPFLMKYAFSPDFGITVGGDSHVSLVDADGKRTTGRGDTTLLFKHRWQVPDSKEDAFGLEWGVKAPTARDEFGSGRSDYIVNGIFSTEWRGNTVDFNLSATNLGRVDSGSRDQLGWAVAASREVSPGWWLAGELSGSARRGATGQGQALVALAYSVSERVTLDAGLAVGVTRAAADRNVFLGVSILLAKLR